VRALYLIHRARSVARRVKLARLHVSGILLLDVL